jgi:hypothetical protein
MPLRAPVLVWNNTSETSSIQRLFLYVVGLCKPSSPSLLGARGYYLQTSEKMQTAERESKSERVAHMMA